MKSIILNPNLPKVIVCLLVVLLLVVLFWPSAFVSDELLSQIKPGMTVEAAISILGNTYSGKFTIWGPPSHGPDHHWKWEAPRLGLIAIAPDGCNPINSKFQHHYWVSDKRMLLWVESQGDEIVHAWILPLKKSSFR